MKCGNIWKKWRVPSAFCTIKKSPPERAVIVKFWLIFSGKELLGFLTGDLAGVAFCHDLHILVVELVAQIEEGGDHHTDDRYKCVDDPQTALGLFRWVSVEVESFAELEQLGIQQTPGALKGLWIVYALVPVIGLILSTGFYLCYKLNDKDVQIMAKCNSGEITREKAENLLSRKY